MGASHSNDLGFFHEQVVCSITTYMNITRHKVAIRVCYRESGLIVTMRGSDPSDLARLDNAIHRINPYLSNTLTNLYIALYFILLYCVVRNCIVLFIYCYVDIIQYNAMHKFVGVLDNPR